MRHFIELTLAPHLLPSGMAPCSPTCALVAGSGTPTRLPAGHRGTPTATINIAPIAASADAHRHIAAPAAIQPVALLPLLHRTPPQRWTAPGCTRLNAVRKIAPTGIAPLEAREFFKGFPGLLCLGVAASLSGNGSAHQAAKSNTRELRSGASAADGGRLRFDYLVDDINKTKITPNPLPEPRWSNRAFPQN